MAKLEELALGTDLSELGRFMVSKNQSDMGSFRTPQIRNVAITGPYMHDGSMETLWDVIDHYNKGGEANRYLDGGIEPLGLTEAVPHQSGPGRAAPAGRSPDACSGGLHTGTT